ncbi:MAG: UDP-3-O-(3-hydroxymyristoyl)glucosamine N-acyltransferase [Chitinophagaceae bacterium]|nr:UDP-3-O-(3-hydroxymyristoyl)glucosamine N-acyltransferase [Chitinophagaceae bacterium]MDP1764318.1 UDP-3-O-(3-hydroxymyristoyl)glucosamine N-acyltransferase [Sediminibacterium sp.]MDP1812552.1 UDP-3-O-(3-hydroxymyristoyl)glucosamine N-acyltransferase [Sediminibacterium sp.]MDP3128309.1 UDP-3-O-(3-hydroxymyristoyl)glucosamine N-acyltransferase [Sediminibacterium sp.]
MQFTASQIALLINGKLIGDAAATIVSFGKIEEAIEGQLSFLANPKYEEYLYHTKASVVIINESLELKQPVTATLVRVPDAYSAFATLLTKYQELISQQLTGIQQPSYIDPTALLGEHVFVAAFVYIGAHVTIGKNVKLFPGVVLGNDVKVGDNSVLHAGVKIYMDCVIGKNVTIHAGSVIGSDGFGYAPQANGSYHKVPQIGNVVIEDFVEIGANATIDRATMGSTIIRTGVKLDNLIQVAHNVEVGTNTVIAAQVGISGSTKIGKNVLIGGQAGVAGHISIADGSKIAGQSGVTKSIKDPNKSLNGTPAMDFSSYLRIQAMTRNLPDLEKRVKELEKMVDQLLTDRVNA